MSKPVNPLAAMAAALAPADRKDAVDHGNRVTGAPGHEHLHYNGTRTTHKSHGSPAPERPAPPGYQSSGY